jgi:hypothetical protein
MPEIPTALKDGSMPPLSHFGGFLGPSAQPLLVSPQALLPACPAVDRYGLFDSSTD